MIRAAIFLLCVFLCGCAKEWRTGEAVVPSTYQAPAYRSATSVGRLSRIAVMRAEMYIETESEQAEPADRRDQLGRELQASITAYLMTQKGYDARAIDAPAPATDISAIREAGQHHGVDGVVIIERWIAKPWSTAKGVLNVFALNIPLFRAMSAVNLRIAIYETASGRLVWKQELKGEDSGTSIDLQRALGDLENAVPQQLRR